jgi:hypothetical protein
MFNPFNVRYGPQPRDNDRKHHPAAAPPINNLSSDHKSLEYAASDVELKS